MTFKYSLGAEFIDWLKTFAYLGLDSKEHVRVGDVSVAPRDVLAAVLPNPAKLGHLMHGKTCAGTWVRGTYDGAPREVYLYHVADNETTMRDWGSQAVLWQTAICPVRPRSVPSLHSNCCRMGRGTQRGFAALKPFLRNRSSTCLVTTAHTMGFSRWVPACGQVRVQPVSPAGTGRSSAPFALAS
ncbi:MAG: hypothetical protein RIQ63_1375 [Actinomycetota bacterium]